MEKLCTKCGTVKPLDQFHAKKSRPDGHQSYCILCKKGMDGKYYLRDKDGYADRNNRNRQKLREEVDEIKAKQGCKFCEENNPCCLDFHHEKQHEKEATVSRFVQVNARTKAMREIKKCIVVCRNCHAKIHAGYLS